MICTNISPALRPRMADVVSILVDEKTFEQIKPPADDHELNVAVASGNAPKLVLLLPQKWPQEHQLHLN
ncbi:hypothetical protein ACE6H2_019990 [Prunus campanulata]